LAALLNAQECTGWSFCYKLSGHKDVSSRKKKSDSPQRNCGIPDKKCNLVQHGRKKKLLKNTRFKMVRANIVNKVQKEF